MCVHDPYSLVVKVDPDQTRYFLGFYGLRSADFLLQHFHYPVVDITMYRNSGLPQSSQQEGLGFL